MAYGTASGVAAYCGVYTLSGEFTDKTNPRLVTVENWLDQVSALMDTSLASQGFVVPLTETNAVNAATSIVEQLVSDLAKGANNTGRFFSENALKNGVSFWRIITRDIDDWVAQYAPGLEENGANRNSAEKNEFGFRDADESGETLFPIFQRKGFGNRFQDWDNA